MCMIFPQGIRQLFSVLILISITDIDFILQLYHELRSHLRGKFPDLHFYVDRWPEPQAAAAVTDPASEQVRGNHCRFYSLRTVIDIEADVQLCS